MSLPSFFFFCARRLFYRGARLRGITSDPYERAVVKRQNSGHAQSRVDLRARDRQPIANRRAGALPQSGRFPSKYQGSCPFWHRSCDPQEVADAEDYSSFESLSDFGLSMSDFGATPQQVADT